MLYDVGVRTPNPTQRRTYSKTFITSVFSVVLSGAQTPSTEYKSECEYEKSFITLGPGEDFVNVFSKFRNYYPFVLEKGLVHN